MTAIRIARSACTHALATPALTLTIYLVNLLIAFPAFTFAHAVLSSALGTSLAGESLLSGFDSTIWHDLMNAGGFSLSTLLQFAVPFAVLGAVAQTFLAGGVLDQLVQEKRFSTATFFRACGTYLGRFLRIWILTALILALIAFLYSMFLATVLTLSARQPDSDRAAAIAVGISLPFLALLLLLVFMASDYARVSTVVQGKRSSWKAVGGGFLFVLRNPVNTMGLHLLLLLLLGVVIALYLLLEGPVHADSPLTILLVVVLQQLFVIIRAAIRVAFSAGEVILYEERKPRPVVFYGWDDSPPFPGQWASPRP